MGLLKEVVSGQHGFFFNGSSLIAKRPESILLSLFPELV